MKSTRPILTLNRNYYLIVLNSIAGLIVFSLWVFTIFSYARLPNSIPSHFDMTGNVDGYSSKGIIFMLPIIMTLLFILMSWVIKFPHRFNYPFEINESNALYQYTLAVKLITILKLLIATGFAFSLFSMTNLDSKLGASINSYFVLIMMVSLVLPIVIYLILAARSVKKSS